MRLLLECGGGMGGWRILSRGSVEVSGCSVPVSRVRAVNCSYISYDRISIRANWHLRNTRSGLCQEAEETCLTSAPAASWTTWRIFCMNIGNTVERVIGGYPYIHPESWGHWIEWMCQSELRRRDNQRQFCWKIYFCFSFVDTISLSLCKNVQMIGGNRQ